MKREARIDPTTIRDLRKQFEAQGYDVLADPKNYPDLGPDLRPDFVASRGSEKIWVEVVLPSEKRGERLSRLTDRFLSHPDWKLAIYVAKSLPEAIQATATAHQIRKALEDVQLLKSSAQLIPALVMAWGAFEAVGRKLVDSQQVATATGTISLVDQLISEGFIDQVEREKLREIAIKRSALVHGRFDTVIAGEEIDTVVELAERLMLELPTGR